MKYIKRHIENAITDYAKMFPAVLITGSRQVGKTTMLRNVQKETEYVTLDDPRVSEMAKKDGSLFFQRFCPPITIDEVQYAPELMRYIKMAVDADRKNGQFFLSGSQKYSLMQGISESLAGRIGILELMGLSMREINNDSFARPFLPEKDYIRERSSGSPQISYKDLWKLIHRGGLPEMYVNENIKWDVFYSAYVKTCIERDVRQLTQIDDEIKFTRFMTALAQMTGQLLNKASIANETDVSQPTVDRWLSILQASGLVILIQPYHNNALKRAVKTPKVYFTDTGLAAYLTRWDTAEVMESGAMSGQFFETFVVCEIMKSYHNAGALENIYYYRDNDQNEIDLVIRKGDTLYPVEIKKRSYASKKDIRAFKKLDQLAGLKRGTGAVICMTDTWMPVDEKVYAVPVSYI